MMTEAAKQTIFWTKLAFDKDGKQAGVPHLSYSVTRRNCVNGLDHPDAIRR